jgi:DNA modification methylase/ParB-like chromosome segregation protein Spo0J
MLIHRSQLVIGDRQRKKMEKAQTNELKMMIVSDGLLHAPVAFPLEDDKYLLIAGGRRTGAIDLLASEGTTFRWNGQEIKPGEFPITIADNLATPLQRKEAELNENIGRVDLSWQETAQARADIHSMRLSQNPQQTLIDTAREIVAKGGHDGASSAKYLQRAIQEAVLITQHLDDPSIAQARNATEAHSLVLKKLEEKVNAAIARRRISALPAKPKIEIRKGDLLRVLPDLDPDQFDLLLADPPYGIDAGAGGFRSRTVHHHNYVDTEASAREIAQCILTEGFRLAKRRANLFLFTDIKHWDWLQRVSAQIGWTPFRRPLIWGKSDSEGLAPWGAQGPRITTEFIFFATKGEKGLLASPIDYLRVNRVPRRERIHAAEKPVELLRRLIECSTLPGDRLLDPCCGSGSSLVAAKESGRIGLGIERDDTYFNTAMSNVYSGGVEDAKADGTDGDSLPSNEGQGNDGNNLPS